MNLIALFLGLVLEKLLTRWLHLRQPHWFDGYFDWCMQHFNRLDGVVAILGAALVALLPVLPVLAIAWSFDEVLLGVPYLVFAALVLLFSLGPRDLGDDVDEFARAQDAGDISVAHQPDEYLELASVMPMQSHIRGLYQRFCVAADADA